MDNKIYIDTRLETDNVEKDAGKIRQFMEKLAKNAAKAAGSLAKSFGCKALRSVKILGSAILSAAMIATGAAFGAFNKLGNLLKKGFSGGAKLAGKAFEGIKNKIASSNKGFGNGIKNILNYVIGLKLLSKALQNISKYYQEGFQNLAKYNNGQNAVNKSASNLKSAMTTLGNSLAAAFAPILTVIEPIITGFINKLTELANTIGMVIAKITGKDTFTKAIKVQKDYAKSLSGSASAAKKGLAAFDELNTLQDKSGGGSSDSTDNMFETVSIKDANIPIVDMIKDAWKNADFAEIGSLVGTKLKEALDDIPWTEIQENARKIAHSVATLLNGFFETEGLGTSIGKTIGESLNTAVYFLQEFVTTLNWKAIGKTIADTINGLFGSVDWKAIGDTFEKGINGVLDMIMTAIENTQWWEMGEKVAEAFKEVDWNAVADKTFEMLGEAFGGMSAFFGGLFKEAFDGIYDFFSKEIEEAGGNVAEGILMGISKGLVAIGDWVKEHIFKPFLDGFKKVFGIHSPSTVMAEQGEYLMEGVKKGIEDKIQSVIEAIIELWDKMKKKTFSAVNSIKESVQTVFSSMKEKVVNIFEGMWGAIKNTINWILSGIESMANGIVRGLNKVIDALNTLKIDAPGWLTDLTGISSLGFNIPNIPEISIPKLATGNVIPRQAKEQAYILGDNNREAEVVSPVSTMKQAFKEAMQEMGGFQTGDINIVAEGDVDAIIRFFNFRLSQESNRIGKTLVKAGTVG